MIRKIFLIVVVLFASLSLHAESKKENGDEVDYLSLASVLIRDGYYDRAIQTLKSVNLDSNETDKVRFYTLRGVANIKKQNYYPAIKDFEQSFVEGQTEKRIRIYLAKAYYTVKDYNNTIRTLDLVPELMAEDKALISMKAQSQWKLGLKEDSLETVKFGISKFPQFPTLHRQKFFYLIEMKLFQSAKDSGLNYLSLYKEAEPEDYLGIGNAFRKSGDFYEALKFLQIAQLKFPNEPKILIEMGHAYIDKGELLSAAQVFEKASLLDNRYAQEASELYRRVKDYYHTLYLNAKIIDQKEKFKQRLALYLELGHFEQAAAMETGLSRIGLLDEDNIRYALAFALSKVGKYRESEKHLKYITETSLFKKATQLRASMEGCRQDMWKCEL
jgi:thioredoxin-like negative regulator of GroEL